MITGRTSKEFETDEFHTIIAPEMMNEGINATKESDIFCCGSYVLYTLSYSFFIFIFFITIGIVIQCMLNGSITADLKNSLNGCSDALKVIINALVEKDPRKRPNCQKVLGMEWLTSNNHSRYQKLFSFLVLLFCFLYKTL